MNKEELTAVFNQQASSYNTQWTRMAPIFHGLYFLIESVFAKLPAEARILSVGAGTGNELIHFAEKFPGWNFTVVEPSGAMLDICRYQVKKFGFTSRCYFHEGYLDSLPIEKMHDAATCVLVSQFITEQAARSIFFQQIANRLQPDGMLAIADLSYEVAAENYNALLEVWQRVMTTADASPEGLQRMKAAYTKDVAVLPPTTVASIITAGGFKAPVPFFQAGLLHAWFAQRAAGNVT